MENLNESIISPMLDSAKEITRADHVKRQYPEFPVLDNELQALENSAAIVRDMYIKGAAATDQLVVSANDIARLIATVRALQRDLAEARAKLVDARELLKEMS